MMQIMQLIHLGERLRTLRSLMAAFREACPRTAQTEDEQARAHS